MDASKTVEARTPAQYIAALNEPRRAQIQELHDLIRRTVPDLEPHMLSGMIAFGSYHYRYESGREGDWFVIGLANQKSYISLYVMGITEDDQYVAETYKDRLPKANIGKSCVRIRKLEDIDLDTLSQLIREGAEAAAVLDRNSP